MSEIKFPLPDREASLRAGAAYIEHKLHSMRARSQELYEARRDRDGEEFDGSVRPQYTSHEADLMEAVHLAVCMTTLRMLADQERE